MVSPGSAPAGFVTEEAGVAATEISVKDAVGVVAVMPGGATREKFCRERWRGGLNPFVTQREAAAPVSPCSVARLLMSAQAGSCVFSPEETARVGRWMRGVGEPNGYAPTVRGGRTHRGPCG